MRTDEDTGRDSSADYIYELPRSRRQKKVRHPASAISRYELPSSSWQKQLRQSAGREAPPPGPARRIGRAHPGPTFSRSSLNGASGGRRCGLVISRCREERTNRDFIPLRPPSSALGLKQSEEACDTLWQPRAWSWTRNRPARVSPAATSCTCVQAPFPLNKISY